MMLSKLKLAAPQLLTLLAILFADRIVFPGFFSLGVTEGRLFGPVVDVLVRGAPIAILAIGMTMVIATKGVDLSVGAIIAICGAVAATMSVGHASIFAILSVTLAVGMACGLWNGVLIAILDIQPIIATLILMVAGRGIAQLITEGHIITFSDANLEAVSASNLGYVPMPVLIVGALTLGALALTRRTALGLMLESIGINRRASMFAGVNAPAVIIASYVISGLCAAIAGLIICADIKGADANNAGLWNELDAILAVVIGGTSLVGGRFSIVLSVVGAMIIQAMNAGILLSGYPPQMNLIVKAVVIVSILILQSPAAKVWFALAVSGRAK